MKRLDWAGLLAGVLLSATSTNGFAAGMPSAGAHTIGCNDDNRRPWVALTSPVDGAKYAEPATIPLAATVSDHKGQLTRVDFYDGTTLIGSAASTPYTFDWSNVAAGTHTVSTKAYGAAGAIEPCGPVTIIVSPTDRLGTPRMIVFAAPPDHATAVTSYVFEVFAVGANPDKDTPVATTNLGKPEPDGKNEITVEREAFFRALPPGRYFRVVKAVGPGGAARSAPVPLTLEGKGGD